MDIALIGYGKMGKEIERIASTKGISVVTIDPNTPGAQFSEISEESLSNVDVCIDFTHPDVIMENIAKVCELKKNLVIGTTGWYDHMDEVKELVQKNDIGCIWSGNFSIGVNMFFEMVKSASTIIDKFDDYDSFVHEFHHNQKADSPSGTAIMIAEIMKDSIKRKDTIVTEELKRKIEPNELHVSSTRGGSIPGTHIVGFDSLADTIELKHTARNRAGFASGSLLAAEWVNGKKGFFEISDMMNEIVGGK